MRAWTEGESVKLISLMLVLALAWPAAAQEASTGSQARPVALVGGMLLDGYEAQPIHDAIVLVKGPRVVAAGSANTVSVPADAVRIDTRGKTGVTGIINIKPRYLGKPNNTIIMLSCHFLFKL